MATRTSSRAQSASFFAYDPGFTGGVFVSGGHPGYPVDPSASDLLAEVQEATSAGTIFGVGSGNSSAGRLMAWIEMLKDADALIEAGALAEACDALTQSYLRADGEDPPPDFVDGPARATLADDVLYLWEALRCGAPRNSL